MPVTSKELCRNLQRADEQLNRVRQQLICGPSLDAPQLLPLLKEVAGILETLERDGKDALIDQSARKWLKTIRQRAIRIKTLLDSAAGVYEGVSRPPQMQVSYGPDGFLLSREPGRRISIQA